MFRHPLARIGDEPDVAEPDLDGNLFARSCLRAIDMARGYYSLIAWLVLILPLALTEAFLPERALGLSGRWRTLRLPLLCLGVIAAAGPPVLIFEVVYLRAGLMLGLLTVPMALLASITLLFWRIADWAFGDGGEGRRDSREGEPDPEPPWWPEFEQQLFRYARERASKSRDRLPV